MEDSEEPQKHFLMEIEMNLFPLLPRSKPSRLKASQICSDQRFLSCCQGGGGGLTVSLRRQQRGAASRALVCRPPRERRRLEGHGKKCFTIPEIYSALNCEEILKRLCCRCCLALGLRQQRKDRESGERGKQRKSGGGGKLFCPLPAFLSYFSFFSFSIQEQGPQKASTPLPENFSPPEAADG